MKIAITKISGSTFVVIIGFGLLTFTSLFSGLQEYLKMSGAEYLRLNSLMMMVITMVSMVLVGTLWLRVKIGHLLFYSSIPIGLIWSINEFVSTLSNMGSKSELAMAITNILLPAFISGLVCALAFFLTPRAAVKTQCDAEIPFKKAIVLMAIPFLAISGMYVTSVWYFDLLLDWEPAVILSCCLVLSLIRERASVDLNYADFGVRNVGAVMLDAGKVTAFLGAAIVALFYIAFSRLDAPKVIGPITAIGLDAILLGVMVYLAGLLLSITNTAGFNETDLRLDAWHLAEAYAFVLLAVVGPASLFDAFG